MTNQQGAPEALRTIQRFNNIAGLMNPAALGLYVRYEDHVAAITASQPVVPSPWSRALEIRMAQGWKLKGDRCPVLYTDTINDEGVGRDDLWLCTTAAFNSAQQPAPSAAPTQDMIAAVLQLVDLEQGDVEDHRYDDGSKLAEQICKAVVALVPQTSPTPQADPLQPIVGLQEQAGMYADDFAPQADSQPAKTELFNPLKGGNPETALQMAAVLAIRDSQPAPVVGRMSPSKEWLETRLAIADDSGVQAGVPPKNARPCDAPPGCNSHNCLECNDYPRADRAPADSAELERLRERVSRIGIDVDRALRGEVNPQSPLGTLRLQAIAAQAADSVPTIEYLRSQITGMSVSVDVSTGDDDAGHRYFGTVTEVMECQGDKHGVTLLVQDAEPNFKADSVLEDAARWNEVLMHIGANNLLGGAQYVLRGIKVPVNVLQGSVAQHFTKSIDAARKQGGA